ncbi:MAG: EI24 domain-containing protein [Bdellovibrionales bacterium]|nr:EI24 domain-containing protein [Bdellovibrionales bacterium]
MRSTLASRSREFLQGFTSPLRVLGLLLENPGLLGLFILPMAITLIVVSSVIYGVLIGLWGAFQNLFQSILGSYSAIGTGVLSVIAGALLMYFSALSLGLLIQLFASPFNDILSEKTELACGENPPQTSLRRLIVVFLLDLRKTGFTLSLTLILFLLGLIPGFGLLSIPGLALVQAFTFLSYPLSRRTIGLRGSLGWIANNFYRSLGFGLITLALFSIPVINLFALPVSVIAGTLVYLKK